MAIKQKHIAQERNKMEKKYKMFRETREALMKTVDDKARSEVASPHVRKSVPKGELSINAGISQTIVRH